MTTDAFARVAAELESRYGPAGAGAAARLKTWLSGALPFAHEDVLTRHLDVARVPLLFDAFWQDLPFGTGGRRGRVGYGSNRMNETTVAMTVQGHCDGAEDAERFEPGSFDVVAARQVVNGLYDPLAAFRHWHRWLRPGGAVLVVEGLYGRDGWRGAWEEEIDVLPLSAVQTMATVPYLLESVGFRIEAVERMQAVNALRVTRTPRYVVVARSPLPP